ncbi:tetratricopeptide repeat protein [Chloroflexi bacterium TSY]|nr:tetratricopeptide repeat protein [Chloroflexi bacterium TSY]
MGDVDQTTAGTTYDQQSQNVNEQTNVAGDLHQTTIHAPNAVVEWPVLVNVPSMPNHFVGRDELVKKVAGQLVSGQQLALSAEGLPGVGKTTLAVALAHHPAVLTHFKDGVLWGGLGKQPDVMSILATWAEELGRDVSAHRTAAERAQVVKTAIGQRALLLVIDDAWELETTQLLRCGGANCCHLLTTRNQAIARDFAGKSQIETVPVLDEETAFQLLTELAEEACAAAPDVARQLIQSVGGLPLTIELLGGYLATPEHSRYPELATHTLSQMLSPPERMQLAAQRLGALDGPTVTLQETIMLSLEDESLPPEAVAAFYALGAFAPKPLSFDRAAAAAVAETDLATLALLASRNLLDDSQGLDQLTLHQELANLAATHTPPAAVARHRAHYLGLVNADREDWREIEPLYGQLQWAWEAAPDDEQLSHFQWAIDTYQSRRGLWGDLVAWLQRLLHLAQSQEWQAEEGRYLNSLGMVYANQGRWDDAILMYEDSLLIKRDLGDRYGEGITLGNLGNVYDNQGRWDDAILMYEDSLTIKRDLGDRYGEGITLGNLGNVYDNQGRWDDAILMYEDSLTIKRDLGDRYGISQSTMGLGMVYANQGRWDDAILMYEDSLTIKRDLGDRYGEGHTLNNLGSVYANQGRWDDAILMYEDSLTIKRDLGDRHGEGITLNNLGMVYYNQGRWDDAILMYEDSLTIKRDLGDRHGEGTTLMNLGTVYHNQEESQKAEALWQEALTKLHPDSPTYQRLSQRLQEDD